MRFLKYSLEDNSIQNSNLGSQNVSGGILFFARSMVIDWKGFSGLFVFFIGLYTKFLSCFWPKWAWFTMPQYATRLSYMWWIPTVAILSSSLAKSIFTTNRVVGTKVGIYGSSSCQSWRLWLSQILPITWRNHQRRWSLLVGSPMPIVFMCGKELYGHPRGVIGGRIYEVPTGSVLVP